MESELRPLMEMGPILARSEHSCGLELLDLKGRQRCEVWEDLKDCVCAWACDLLRLCCIAGRISCACSAVACLSCRISSSKFTVPIREPLCLNKASFVRKCHRSACIRCKIECPSSTKTCKAMPGYSNGAFHHEKTDGQSEKGQSLWQRNSSSPHPTPPPGPISPFTLLPLLLFHAIALTGKHSICGNII